MLNFVSQNFLLEKHLTLGQILGTIPQHVPLSLSPTLGKETKTTPASRPQRHSLREIHSGLDGGRKRIARNN